MVSGSLFSHSGSKEGNVSLKCISRVSFPGAVNVPSFFNITPREFCLSLSRIFQSLFMSFKSPVLSKNCRQSLFFTFLQAFLNWLNFSL